MGRWILLLVSTIIFPLILGYTLRIMRGDTEPPELDGFMGMFIDGILLLIIYIVYTIPVMLIALLSAALYLIPVPQGIVTVNIPQFGHHISNLYLIPVPQGIVTGGTVSQELLASQGSVTGMTAAPGLLGIPLGILAALLLTIFIILLAIVIGLSVNFAAVRFARTGRMGEAFNIRAIIGHI